MSLLPPDLPDKEQLKGVTKCDSLIGEVFLEEDLSMDALLSLWHDFSDVLINDWDEIEVSQKRRAKREALQASQTPCFV